MQIKRRKSSVRSKMGHPFLIIKCFFGYSKTVYRGLAKKYAPTVYVVYQHKSFDVHPGRQTATRLRQAFALFSEKGAKMKKSRHISHFGEILALNGTINNVRRDYSARFYPGD